MMINRKGRLEHNSKSSDGARFGAYLVLVLLLLALTLLGFLCRWFGQWILSLVE